MRGGFFTAVLRIEHLILDFCRVCKKTLFPRYDQNLDMFEGHNCFSLKTRTQQLSSGYLQTMFWWLNSSSLSSTGNYWENERREKIGQKYPSHLKFRRPSGKKRFAQHACSTRASSQSFHLFCENNGAIKISTIICDLGWEKGDLVVPHNALLSTGTGLQSLSIQADSPIQFC